MSNKKQSQQVNLLYDLIIVTVIAYSIWCWFQYDKGVLTEYAAKFRVCLIFFAAAALNVIITIRSKVFAVKGFVIQKKDDPRLYGIGLAIVFMMCAICGVGVIYYAMLM